MGSKSRRTWYSANKLSSSSLQVKLRKVGFGRRIWRRTGWQRLGRRERGMWTIDKETGRRETVTLSDMPRPNQVFPTGDSCRGGRQTSGERYSDRFSVYGRQSWAVGGIACVEDGGWVSRRIPASDNPCGGQRFNEVDKFRYSFSQALLGSRNFHFSVIPPPTYSHFSPDHSVRISDISRALILLPHFLPAHLRLTKVRVTTSSTLASIQQRLFSRYRVLLSEFVKFFVHASQSQLCRTRPVMCSGEMGPILRILTSPRRTAAFAQEF